MRVCGEVEEYRSSCVYNIFWYGEYRIIKIFCFIGFEFYSEFY